MGRRFRWILAGLIVGLLVGGAAYAGYNVAIVDSSSSDHWYACVSNTGAVRASTLRLNNYPTLCPRSTDTIRTWNAYGPTGSTGVTGTDGSTGATGATGTAASGDGYGQFVGAYSMMWTNQGCAGNELRMKLVVRAGRVASSPLGECTALYCSTPANPILVLNVGERCQSSSDPVAAYWGPAGTPPVFDVTAKLGLQTGKVYFSERSVEPVAYEDSFLFNFGTRSYLRTSYSSLGLSPVTRHVIWDGSIYGLFYSPDTLPNLSGMAETSLLKLPTFVVYEVAS